MVPAGPSCRSRDDPVAAAVDDRDGHRDRRQQPGQHGELMGILVDVAHRLGEAVAVVAGQVVRADVVGDAAGDGEVSQALPGVVLLEPNCRDVNPPRECWDRR
jgi:hypothetical protein